MRLIALSLLLPFAAFTQSAPAPASAPAPMPPAPLGRPAAWTATTHEAATGDANKKALEDAKAATVTGEVIDYSCFLQLGKTGEKHRDCGRKCILAGQPAGLLLTSGKIVLLMPEEHHPRRDGQVSLKEFLAEHTGQQVTATGMLRESHEVEALFVVTLEPVALRAPNQPIILAPPPVKNQ